MKTDDILHSQYAIDALFHYQHQLWDHIYHKPTVTDFSLGKSNYIECLTANKQIIFIPVEQRFMKLSIHSGFL